MIHSNWNDRFLMAILAIIVLFIIVISWIIVRENVNTATSTAVSPQTISPSSRTTSTTNTNYTNSSAQASPTTKQLYERNQSLSNISQSTHSDTDQATQYYNQGYEWATQQRILSKSDCQQIAAEYKAGCQGYLEVKNYISQTDQNTNMPSN